MRFKIIAIKRITSKEVDASYSVLFQTLNHNLNNIEKALNRLDPILHSHRKDEKAAISEIQTEINYIHAHLKLCLSSLSEFEKLLGEKYIAAHYSAGEITKKAIYNKRLKFLKYYTPLTSEISHVFNFIKNNNKTDDIDNYGKGKDNLSRGDFQYIYNEIQSSKDSIQEIIRIIRNNLNI